MSLCWASHDGAIEYSSVASQKQPVSKGRIWRIQVARPSERQKRFPGTWLGPLFDFTSQTPSRRKCSQTGHDTSTSDLRPAKWITDAYGRRF